MTFDAPELLILFAAFLYLYDSTILLFGNEGLLAATGRNAWKVIYRPRGIFLFGRVVACPNPLLPHRPVFRLAWRGTDVNLGDETDWADMRKSYDLFMPLVYGSALSIFLLLPLALLVAPSTMLLLKVAAAIYAFSGGCAAAVICRGEKLQLTRKKAWSLAAECVLCPPIAVNIVRRISLAQSVGTSVPAVGLRLLSDADWMDLKGKLLRDLDDEIESAGSEAERRELESGRQRLAESARIP